ncbi:MAG TPA: hypothetical protein PLV32_09565 [Chitinophagaceae bacterium]|nr:hypothetical protein [Chitinophagaceae bacterium]
MYPKSGIGCYYTGFECGTPRAVAIGGTIRAPNGCCALVASSTQSRANV